MGDAGVGLLGAAMGLGGLVGALSRSRWGPGGGLARVHVLALVLGRADRRHRRGDQPGGRAGALGVVGLGNALVDVAGFTLLQRASRTARGCRVLGLRGGGRHRDQPRGLTRVLLIERVGIEQALVITGLILPVAAVLSGRRSAGSTRRASRPGARRACSARVPLFRPLPLAALERLADGMHRVHYDAGRPMMTQGE